MSVRQCRDCGKLFTYIRSPYCPDCQEKIERQYLDVREYLAQHRHADVQTVARETGVAEKVILHLMREGRLTMVRASELQCEHCHAPIQSGRYCGSCMATLRRNLDQARQSLSRQDKPAGAGSAGGSAAADRSDRTGQMPPDRSGMHIQNRRNSLSGSAHEEESL